MVSVVRFLSINRKWNTLNKKTIKIFHSLHIIFLSLIAYNIIPDEKDYQRKTMKISIFDIFFDIN